MTFFSQFCINYVKWIFIRIRFIESEILKNKLDKYIINVFSEIKENIA